MGWSYRLSTILLAVMLSLAESAIYVLVRAPEGAAQSYVLNVDHSTDPPVGADLSFTRTTIEDSEAPWGKNLADVDGDGDGFLDILTGGGDVLQVVDMNADGAVDVIVNGWPIIWFENPRGSGGNPQAQWSGHMIEQEDYSHDVRIADIDRDGKLDVVAFQEYGATFLYLQNSADSWSKTTPSNALVTAGGLALADLDADGRVDVVGDGYWLRQPATPANGARSAHGAPAAASTRPI